MICGRCGAETPDDARFCPACGNELAGGTGHQERKLVSILFVDVVGSTARADGADPEDVRDRNQLHFSDARERIERHGGIVEKYIGDAVMAVFGAPLARVDDAERAVRAGLSILEDPGAEPRERRTRPRGARSRVHRRGGDRGGARPGRSARDGRHREHGARLQNAAAPDGLLVGEETHRLTRHAFRFESIPAVEAKGKAAPVAAWSVLEALEAPGSLGLGLDAPAPADEAIHLLFTMRMLVEHLAEQQPVLLVFEDVRWADDTLLDAIDYLVSHVRDSRMVVLALARPEFLEAGRTWGGGMVGHTTLPLEPLSGDHAKAVARSVAARGGRLHDRPRRLRGRGNPLFLEELGASVADAVSGDELPSTVWAAIAGRIDTLPAGARAALLHASVIGQDFWRGVLEGTGELAKVDGALEAFVIDGSRRNRPSSSGVSRLPEELVDHSLVLAEEPELRDLAALEVVDEHVVRVQA